MENVLGVDPIGMYIEIPSKSLKYSRQEKNLLDRDFDNYLDNSLDKRRMHNYILLYFNILR